MEPLDRRAFIVRSGAAAAAIGAAVLLPGELVGATTKPASAPEKRGRKGVPLISSGESGSDSIIAHVRNLGSGEIAVFARDEVFMVYDRTLAAGLARAAGGR